MDYENGIMNASRPYEVMCCKGLSIDLLERLSKDLNFEYQMYIVADRKYGALVNGSWNGLVEELEKGINTSNALIKYEIEAVLFNLQETGLQDRAHSAY